MKLSMHVAMLALFASLAAGSQAAPPAATSGYGVKLGGFFSEKDKETAKKSFEQHFAKTKECPKDMERKGKTCRALVQGHYWAVGQALNKQVETFELPEDVQARLPKPPEGYEYVRAGEDILMLSKGLHLVVDVMQDVVA